MPGLMTFVLLGWFPAIIPTANLPRAIMPVVYWDESVSEKVKGAFARCHSDREWEEIWDKYHAKQYPEADRTRPRIEFRTHMVVVICHVGPAKYTDVYDAVEETGCVRVRFRDGPYQWCVPQTEAEMEDFRVRWARMDTFRLCFIVLPVTKKELVFEENESSLIVGPPEWKERGRLPAIKGK